jgi:hypothetical protein
MRKGMVAEVLRSFILLLNLATVPFSSSGYMPLLRPLATQISYTRSSNPAIAPKGCSHLPSNCSAISMAHPVSGNNAHGILGLPSEVRFIIYSHLFDRWAKHTLDFRNSQLTCSMGRQVSRAHAVQILRTCSSIHIETLPTLYSRVRIFYTIKLGREESDSEAFRRQRCIPFLTRFHFVSRFHFNAPSLEHNGYIQDTYGGADLLKPFTALQHLSIGETDCTIYENQAEFLEAYYLPQKVYFRARFGEALCSGCISRMPLECGIAYDLLIDANRTYEVKLSVHFVMQDYPYQSRWAGLTWLVLECKQTMGSGLIMVEDLSSCGQIVVRARLV